MHRSQKLKGLLANVALSLASFSAVLATSLGGEWFVRAMNPRYEDRFGASDMASLHVYSEEYGWAPRAGFRLKLEGWPETTINRAGYRGREYAHARTPGKRRVVMLGDSLAFGYGVADEETSSRQLEDLEPTLEVINLAVQGYGTDQALLRFEREGLAFHPDAAILSFCLANDFRDNAASRALYDHAYPKPFFKLNEGRLVLHREHLRLPWVSRLGLVLHERSVLFNKLQGIWTVPAETRANPPAVHPDRELTVALLSRFAEVARARNVRFVVAVYPTLREFIRPSRRPRVILEATGLKDTVRVDLRPLLESRGVSARSFSEYSFDGSFHATPRGHRLVAEVLADLLKQTGVLPIPATSCSGPRDAGEPGRWPCGSRWRRGTRPRPG